MMVFENLNRKEDIHRSRIKRLGVEPTDYSNSPGIWQKMLGFAIDYPYNIKLKKLKVKEKICIHWKYKYINSVSNINSPKKKQKRQQQNLN